MTISSFTGEHEFLSNFYPAEVRRFGLIFPTVEHAYQAAKCHDLNDVCRFLNATTPGAAKRLGQTVEKRTDWSDIKLVVMLNLNTQKYQDEILREKLLATMGHTLVEGNTWGDTFWGVCGGVGSNHLGKILMDIRERIFNERNFYGAE